MGRNIYYLGRSTGATGDLPKADGVCSAQATAANLVYLPTAANGSDVDFVGMGILVVGPSTGCEIVGERARIHRYVASALLAHVSPPFSRPLSSADSVVIGLETHGRNLAHISKEYLGLAATSGGYRLVIVTADQTVKRIESGELQLAYLGHSRGVTLAATAEMGETKVVELLPVWSGVAKLAISTVDTAGNSALYMGMGLSQREG